MKVIDKILFLMRTHSSDWAAMRKQVEDEFSSRQSMWCVCGKLATGLHESRCIKFNDLVTKETVKRLEHLINATQTH